MNASAIKTRLAELTAATAEAIDPTRHDTEVAEALADYGPGGRWRFAPESARRAGERACRADIAKRAAEIAGRLERAIKEADQSAATAIGSARVPLDAEGAWYKKAGEPLAATAYLQLGMRDELQVARLRSELPSLSPIEMLTRYESALTDPYRQDNATTIRFVEGLSDWRPILPTGREVETAVAMQRIKRRIAEAREERVPSEWREVLESVTEAREVLQRAKNAAAVRPAMVEVDAE